jgi:hypothetical protein
MITLSVYNRNEDDSNEKNSQCLETHFDKFLGWRNNKIKLYSGGEKNTDLIYLSNVFLHEIESR